LRTPSYSVAMNSEPGKGELVVLFAGNSQTEPGHHVGPQILDYHLVHYIESGSGSFHCLGKKYTLEAGSLFFIFPGELVTYASDAAEPMFYRWVGFKGTGADQLLAKLGISAQYPVVRASDRRRTPVMLRRIERTLQHSLPFADLEAGGLLRVVFAGTEGSSAAGVGKETEPAEGAIQQVNQAIRWLSLQYSQPVSIERMSQSLGYHRTYLSKVFKRHTGMSPMSFLLKIRMEKAKTLLTRSLTVEQIASSVGFADPLYFSKQFKKWYGHSPTEYRALMRSRHPFDCSI
jgi:AraC-like DNA-binding protein